MAGRAWKPVGNPRKVFAILNVQMLLLPYICFWCGVINSIQGEPSNPARVYLSPSKVKEWAMDDLNNTILWLDSQEEKVSGNFSFSYPCEFNYECVILLSICNSFNYMWCLIFRCSYFHIQYYNIFVPYMELTFSWEIASGSFIVMDTIKKECKMREVLLWMALC